MVAIDTPTSEETFPNADKLVLPVDAEHTGIRAAGCTTMVLAFVGLFMIFGYIGYFPAIVAILTSLVLAAATSYVLEKYLKQRWPSGRTLEIEDEAIAIRKNGETQRKIDPQQHVNVLTWNFTVKRSSRVKKGWHVLGMSLEQDGEFIPVYTFASPEDFGDFPLSEHFTKLVKDDKKDKDKDKSKPAVNIRQAGEQRRLHQAEYDRGINGAEITFSQFKTYLEFLQKNYHKWMIS